MKRELHLKILLGELFGFENQLVDKNIIAVNIKSDDVFQTLYHEVSHFIQRLSKIRVINRVNIR
jgi:hypothetical protein